MREKDCICLRKGEEGKVGLWPGSPETEHPPNSQCGMSSFTVLFLESPRLAPHCRPRFIIDNFDTVFHPFRDNQFLKAATPEGLILLVPVVTCDLNCRDQT